jgi:hypothetical protein
VGCEVLEEELGLAQQGVAMALVQQAAETVLVPQDVELDLVQLGVPQDVGKRLEAPQLQKWNCHGYLECC